MIGLGRMGFNMAKLLIGAKHDVFVYDIDHKKVEQIAKLGGKPAENPKKLSAGVKISLLSLPMPADVESVVCGQDGILAGSKIGHIIVDLSTSDPFLTRKIAQEAKKQGVGYLTPLCSDCHRAMANGRFLLEAKKKTSQRSAKFYPSSPKKLST